MLVLAGLIHYYRGDRINMIYNYNLQIWRQDVDICH